MAALRLMWVALASTLVGCAADRPRARCHHDFMHVADAPAGVVRGDLLYALDERPLPGSTTHRKAGLLRGVDRAGDTLEVAWYCAPEDGARAASALRGDGLPVALVGQDVEPRLGRCWGQTIRREAHDWPDDRRRPVLWLNLGVDDGVEVGDQYEVLGEARADDRNRRVADFEVLGVCSVLPWMVSSRRAECQLLPDHRFDASWWVRRAYVKRVTAPMKPCRSP